eukprot:15362770-Ditylum_brightwellii.AAC.1
MMKRGGDGGLYTPYISAAKRLRMERAAALGAMVEEGKESGGSEKERNKVNNRADQAKSRKALAAVGTAAAHDKDETK